MTRRIGISALIASVVAIYLLRLDHVAGLYKDDAYYMVLAKAVSQGDGYRLISSAASPIVPSVPPAYALALAPIFALAPAFPDNVMWLKLVSVLAMLAGGLFTFRYFADGRRLDANLAALIALLTVLTPGLVFLATSTTMPECLFFCALIASAQAIERAARTNGSIRSVATAAVITSAAWLVRSAGIALVAAGAGYLLWKRGWRTAGAFVLVCALAYAPWVAYAAVHASTRAERDAHGGSIAYSYADLLQSQSGGDMTRAPIGAADVPRRIIRNLSSVFLHDLGAVMFPAGYRGPDESGLEVFMLSGQAGFDPGSMGLGSGAVTLSIIATVVMLAGAWTLMRRGIGVAEWFCVLSLGAIVLVPTRTYRYVLPLSPFLLAYLLIGVDALASRIRAGLGAPAVRVSAACLLVFLTVEHGAYIARKVTGPPPPWIQDGNEVISVAEAASRVMPRESTAVSTNPALLYLLTGHRAVAYVDPVTSNWPRWHAAGFRYAVALHAVPEPPQQLGYEVLHESARLGLWVVELRPGRR